MFLPRYFQSRLLHILFTVCGKGLRVSSFILTLVVDKDGQVRDLAQAEMIPLKPTYMSFWNKFMELQTKMLFLNNDNEMEHKYSSAPLDWPFMSKNVAYWMSNISNVSLQRNTFIFSFKFL